MSVSEKLATITDNVRRVYSAGENVGNMYGYQYGYQDGHINGVAEGEKAEHDRFWDSYQGNGVRQNYNYAFYYVGWSDDNFYPKYDINAGAINYAFYYSTITNLEQRLKDCGVIMNTDNTKQLYYTAAYSTITHFPEIGGTDVTNAENAFLQCTKLVSIKKITVSNTSACSFTNAFRTATALTEIRFGENISPQNLNLQWSPLSRDSLLSLINGLADKSGESGWSIALGDENLAKLTDEEKAIMASKGWTY